MAMTPRGRRQAPAGSRGTPPWVVFAHAAGLALVFLGERVFSGIAAARWVLTGLGMAVVFGLTLLRWAASRQVGGQRRAVERALAISSTVGCAALLVYLTTAEPFDAKLGIADLEGPTRQRYVAAATVLWIALLLCASLPMAFAERALFPMRRSASVEWRRVRDALVSGLSLGLVAVYGALFTFIADALEVKADFSYFHTARPSESTRKIASSAKGPVSVTAFFPELNPVGVEAATYLRDLARTASNVEVRVVDRLLMPQAARDARVLEDGVVVVEHNLQREAIALGTEVSAARPKLKTLDADFQKTLLKVMRDKRTAYLTTGHGELDETAPSAENGGRTGRGVRQVLAQRNYTVQPLSAASGFGVDVPADASLVVVLGPQRAFRPEELAALERYADRGGRLLLAVDPDAKDEAVGALAEVAGLQLSRSWLANDKIHMRRRYNDSDRVILATNRFSSHAAVSTLSRLASRPVLFLTAGALEKHESAEVSLAIDFAVRAMPDTFGDDNRNFAFDPETEKRGSYALAAAVTKNVAGLTDFGAKSRSDEMRAFVIADGDALSDAVLGNDGNLLLLADAVHWLTGEESFAGALAGAEDVRIEHTKQKDLVWFYGTIFGAPAVVLGGGLLFTRTGKRRALRGRRATSIAPASPPGAVATPNVRSPSSGPRSAEESAASSPSGSAPRVDDDHDASEERS